MLTPRSPPGLPSAGPPATPIPRPPPPTAIATSPPPCATAPTTPPESRLTAHHQPVNQTVRRFAEALITGAAGTPPRAEFPAGARRAASVAQRQCPQAGERGGPGQSSWSSRHRPLPVPPCARPTRSTSSSAEPVAQLLRLAARLLGDGLGFGRLGLGRLGGLGWGLGLGLGGLGLGPAGPDCCAHDQRPGRPRGTCGRLPPDWSQAACRAAATSTARTSAPRVTSALILVDQPSRLAAMAAASQTSSPGHHTRRSPPGQRGGFWLVDHGHESVHRHDFLPPHGHLGSLPSPSVQMLLGAMRTQREAGQGPHQLMRG